MIHASAFPNLHRKKEFAWAPILLRPMIDSPESLVVGVIASDGIDFHIEPANRLERLSCLFGSDYSEAEHAARVAYQSARHQAAQLRACGVSSFTPPSTATYVGEAKKELGDTARQIAVFWMTSISSLYEAISSTRELVEAAPQALVLSRHYEQPATLPSLVLDSVAAAMPQLSQNFSDFIREGYVRNRRPQKKYIDYSSPRITANMEVFPPNGRASAINRVVKRMWDLELERDEKPSANPATFEMLVEAPLEISEQVSDLKLGRIRGELAELEGQADKRGIRFLALANPTQISERILRAEGLQLLA